MVRWTPELVELCKKVLAEQPYYGGVAAAARELTRRTGTLFTRSSIYSQFRRLGLPEPKTFCGKDRPVVADVSAPVRELPDLIGDEDEEDEIDEVTHPGFESRLRNDPQIHELIELAQKRPVSFEEVCDELELAPAKARALVERAQSLGFNLEIHHDELSWRLPEPTHEVQDTGVAPIVGDYYQVAVISDIHYGSKFCLRHYVKDFMDIAYSRGIRHTMVPGDILDGGGKYSKFLMYEQSHRGFDEQAEDAFQNLPYYPDHTYHCIDGNHDQSLSETIGMVCGQALINYFQSRGRHDLRFYGQRGAFLKIGGITIEMWHPGGGGAYARSYKLQKHIEGYPVGTKPDVCLAGHWHQFCYVQERGVNAIMCPTFQGAGSAFSKMLGGAPAIGGMILGWQLTEHGTLRRFVPERVSYYEKEQPRQIDQE